MDILLNLSILILFLLLFLAVFKISSMLIKIGLSIVLILMSFWNEWNKTILIVGLTLLGLSIIFRNIQKKEIKEEINDEEKNDF